MRLPVTLPFVLGEGGEEVITYTFRLPITLPFRIQSSSNGRRNVKLGFSETPQGKVATIQFKEIAWLFEGLVIEENILGQFTSTLNIIEEIKGRIFANCALVDANKVLLQWYGDPVLEFAVKIKVAIDDKYKTLSTHKWDEGSTIIEIGSDEYNILLEGTRNDGISDVITIGEISKDDLQATFTTASNEKIYDIEVNLISKYSINIYV